MNTSSELDQLAAALCAAQANISPARMNAVNPFLKNRYADLSAIIDAVRHELALNDLSYVQMPATPPHGEFGIALTTRLMHSSGQWLEETFFMPMPTDERGKSLMQVAGSAITYARRYALAAMLGVVADEDTDGSIQNDAPRKSAVKPAPRPAEKPADSRGVMTPDEQAKRDPRKSVAPAFRVGDEVKSRKTGEVFKVTAVTPSGMFVVANDDNEYTVDGVKLAKVDARIMPDEVKNGGLPATSASDE